MAADKKHRDEQELERYGVWVKAGPDELDEHDSQSIDLMDIEDSDNDELLITEEEEKLLGELEESALPDFSDFEDSFDDSPEDDFGLSLDSDPEDGDFSVPAEEQLAEDSESRDLLKKIEDDLSALRSEIRQLKEEITGLRIPPVATAEKADTDAGGFFADEEDETIALTGDELDNILDSAEMTEQVAGQTGAEEAPADDDAQTDNDTVSFDDEESIDLSADFTDLENDISIAVEEEPDFEGIEDDEDPALSILSSSDSPEEPGDPDTLEIDIPGMDETIDLDESLADTDVVSIDEIQENPDSDIQIDDMTDFEEITDLDDFGLDESAALNIPAAEEPVDEYSEEEIVLDSGDELVLTESFEDEGFDEGEEVELDLGEDEDIFEASDDADMLKMEMEEISLDDFGMEEESAADEDNGKQSDALAVDDEIEEISLDDLRLDDETGSDDGFEEVELDAVLAEGIEDDLTAEEEKAEDLILEEVNLEQPVDDEDFGDLEIEDIDLNQDEVEDILPDFDTGDDELELVEEVDPTEAASAEADALEEAIELELDETPEPGISDTEDDEIPEITLDEAIDEIESVEEFSIDDDDDAITDLEIDIDDEDEDDIQVTLPDDDFDELPGTEDVDLDSLEALAAAPDLTETEGEEIVSLPDTTEVEIEEINLDEDIVLDLDEDVEELPESDEIPEIEEIEISDEETPSGSDAVEDVTEFDLDVEEDSPEPLVPTPRTIADKAKEALEIGSLPGDLKDEIKEVLKYMDQLLESLPDEKIQEFARSEHFEVYKKIFEELGISD